MRSDQKRAQAHETYPIWVFFDPLYRNPQVGSVNLSALPTTIFRLHLDRRPVDEMLWSPSRSRASTVVLSGIYFSCIRLPALALLVANLLTYLAATLPPVPTGFWDQQPKNTQSSPPPLGSD